MEEKRNAYMPGAYDGREKYIFISYAHKDREAAMEIIGHLLSKSYRLWFDQGITPGSEWDSNIAEHVEHSHVFFALISNAYLQSNNCQDELNYARETGRQRILIYLEKAELTGGMRMRLGQLPAFHKYEYDKPEKFYEELFQDENVKECKGTEKEDREEEIFAHEEAVPQKPASKRRGLSHFLRGKRRQLLSAGLLLLILLVSWLGLTKYQEMLDREKQSQAAFLLTADYEVDEQNFAADWQVFDERFQILAAGSRVTMKKEGENQIFVSLPMDCFGEAGKDKEGMNMIFGNYFLNPMDLYFVKDGNVSDYLPVSRNEILKVEVKNGNIPGAEIELPDPNQGDGSYDYIELTLSESCAEEVKKMTEGEDGGLLLAFDLEKNLSEYYCYKAWPLSEDCRVIALWDSDLLQENLRDLFVYNLTHPGLTDCYSCVCQLPKQWENIKEAEYVGDCQRNVNVFYGNDVTIKYNLYDELRSGEWKDQWKAMKDRLDVIGEPYACGTSPDADPVDMVIRTSVSRMGYPVIQVLGVKDSYYVKSVAGDVAVSVQAENFSWKECEDGTYEIIIDVSENESQTKTLQEITGKLSAEGGRLYLTAGDSNLAVADISEEITDGRLVFKELCLENGSPISSEYEWFLKLMQVCLEKPLFCSIYFESDLFGSVLDHTYDPEGVFGVVRDTTAEQKIREQIKSICPEATTVFSLDGNTAAFSLHLPIDESLPQIAPEMVKEIYQTCDLSDSEYTNMVFYLVDEDNLTQERARIFFLRTYLKKNGKPYVHGIFVNGRLEPLKEAMRRQILQDDFYQELADEEESSWVWEDERE